MNFIEKFFDGGIMTATPRVQKNLEQVMAFPQKEQEAFLWWLADSEANHMDEWDREILRDAQPGGLLEGVLGRVRKDIAQGRTKPLDEVLDDA